MNWLEWIGLFALVVLVLQNILLFLKARNPEKFSNDPKYPDRQFEFNRMSKAFDKLFELRDEKHDPDNEAINNVQDSLEEVIHSTVPLPKESFASDYRSKYVEYSVIYYLASSIINLQVNKEPLVANRISYK